MRNLGGALGDDIDQALGGLLGRFANAARGGQEEMRQALAEAERIDAAITKFQDQKRTPVSLVEEGNLIKNLRPVRRVNAAFDTAVEALVNGYVIFTIEDGVMYGRMYNVANDILYFTFEARRR